MTRAAVIASRPCPAGGAPGRARGGRAL